MTSIEEAEDEPLGTSDQPGLALGFLITLPLFAAYELGLHGGPSALERNQCERLLTGLLRPLGDYALQARWALLAGLGIAALLYLRRRGTRILPRALGSPVEGLVGAFLLGPLLIWMLSFFDGQVFQGVQQAVPAEAPGLWSALRLMGGAPWEELLFRVAFFGVLYLLFARIAGFFGLGRRPALLVGDVGAMVGSSLGFAAFHLASVQSLLGATGEPFEAGTFLWRLLAGLLLAWLYRWRGLATAAWAHGFFNLGLALGVGPGIFLAV